MITRLGRVHALEWTVYSLQILSLLHSGGQVFLHLPRVSPQLSSRPCQVTMQQQPQERGTQKLWK